MKKEVVKQEQENKVVAVSEEFSSWGANQEISSNDISIPKILTMQFMSDKVKSGEAKYGEFRDTMSNELIGSIDDPFEFIPIHLERKWVVYEMIKGKRNFLRVDKVISNPTDPKYNDNAPYQDKEGDMIIERDRVMEFFILLPKEVEAGGAIPYVVPFRRSSLRAGQILSTQMFVKNRAMNLPPGGWVCTLGGRSVSNDDGEFAVMDVKPSRQTTPKELDAAFTWYKTIVAGAVKVDDSDLKTADEASTPQGTF